MGAVQGMKVILTLIAWFGSLVALVALPLLLRRSLRTDRQVVQQGMQPRVRPRVATIDRLHAAGRWVASGPRTIGRLPGTMRQDTVYRRSLIIHDAAYTARPTRPCRRASARSKA